LTAFVSVVPGQFVFVKQTPKFLQAMLGGIPTGTLLFTQALSIPQRQKR
jgi:hypothetical protein